MYLLAFLTYFGFYVSREPYSLVKSTLLKTWAPFNGPDGVILLGILDTVFLGKILLVQKNKRQAIMRKKIGTQNVSLFFNHCAFIKRRATLFLIFTVNVSFGNFLVSLRG